LGYYGRNDRKRLRLCENSKVACHGLIFEKILRTKGASNRILRAEININYLSAQSETPMLSFHTTSANCGRWYLSAAGISSLYWRALHRAIGAIYTAVPRLRFQYLVTGVTVIEPLASIRWHDLQFLMATGRAGDL
jgi:hypothetical protein